MTNNVWEAWIKQVKSPWRPINYAWVVLEPIVISHQLLNDRIAVIENSRAKSRSLSSIAWEVPWTRLILLLWNLTCHLTGPALANLTGPCSDSSFGSKAGSVLGAMVTLRRVVLVYDVIVCSLVMLKRGIIYYYLQICRWYSRLKWSLTDH